MYCFMLFYVTPPDNQFMIFILEHQLKKKKKYGCEMTFLIIVNVLNPIKCILNAKYSKTVLIFNVTLEHALNRKSVSTKSVHGTAITTTKR